jgi:hypothetical protein
LRNKVAFVLLLLYAAVAVGQSRWNREGELSTDMNSHAEFAFTRIIFKSGYSTLPGPGNTSWRDWPEADAHFIRGIKRLTAVDIEDSSRAILLTDEQKSGPGCSRRRRPTIFVNTCCAADSSSSMIFTALCNGPVSCVRCRWYFQTGRSST